LNGCNSFDLAALNPNGIPSLSPGLRAERYPGSTSQTRHNPERVASNPRRSIAKRFNPFRVETPSLRSPRVARASQPWADGCNPCGIEPGAAAPTGRHVIAQGDALGLRRKRISSMPPRASPWAIKWRPFRPCGNAFRESLRIEMGAPCLRLDASTTLIP
jgi:hypothetical protein